MHYFYFVIILAIHVSHGHNLFEYGITVWSTDNFTTSYGADNLTKFPSIDESPFINPRPEDIKVMAARLAASRLDSSETPIRKHSHTPPVSILQLSSACETNDSIYTTLEKYIRKLNISLFLDDPVLYKFVEHNSRKSIFTYVDPVLQHPSVYMFPEGIISMARPRKVYVMREDRSEFFFKKRQYVALRRVNTTEQHYAAVIFYLKDAQSQSPSSNGLLLGGKPVELEFDTWSDRRVHSHKRHIVNLGWLHCNSSILAPCLNRFGGDQLYTLRKAIGGKRPLVNPRFSPNVVATILSSSNGYPTFAANDYFADLDDTVVSAKWVSDVVYDHTNRALGRAFGFRLQELHLLMNDVSMPDAFSYLFHTETSIQNWNRTTTGVKRWRRHRKNFQIGTPNATIEGNLGDLMNVANKTRRQLRHEMKRTRLMALRKAVRQQNSGGLGAFFRGEKGKAAKAKDALGTSAEDMHDATEDGFDWDSGAHKSLDETVLRKSLLRYVDTFVNPGWKTARVRNVTANSTLLLEDYGFIGFGPCDDVDRAATAKEVHSTQDKETTREIVIGFMKALNYHCLENQIELITQLFTDHFLTYDEEGKINFNLTHSALTNKKAKIKTLQKLSLAVEFSLFASAYKNDVIEIETGSMGLNMQHYAPDGTPISRSVFIIGEMIINGINLVQTHLYHREVLLCRNMIVSTKTIFVRLLQDLVIIRDCQRCVHDKIQVENDILFVYGLMQFLLRGVTVSRPLANVDEAFATFFNANLEGIKGRVHWYVSPPPPFE